MRIAGKNLKGAEHLEANRRWEINVKNEAFEVLIEMFMKTYIFRDIKPYIPLKVSRRFGRTCHFHLQGGIIRQERNQHEAGSNKNR
jgi:hypothetical protein